METKKNKKKTKWNFDWVKKNTGFVVTIVVLLIIFICSAIAYQSDRRTITDIIKQQNEISQKFEQNMDKVLVLKSKINGVKANDSLQKICESELYNNEKEMLDLKQELNEKHEETEAEIQSLWMHQIEYFAAFIALVVAVVFFKTLDEKAKEKIQEEIAKITGKKLDVISSNYDEYVRHKNLKKDAKILVLNEKGTSFPKGFIKVLKLFEVNLDIKSNLVEVTGLEEALTDENINKIKEADVIIIENQDNRIKGKNASSLWKIGNTSNLNIKQIAVKANKQNLQEYKNVCYLIELAEKICDTTAIIYYGQQGRGFFPSEYVSPEKQHLISFANAPSQLYGNLLNMLKFKYELEKNEA